MKGEWYEVKVVTAVSAVEPVSGIFYSLGVNELSIEDPNDLIKSGRSELSWDYADIGIFEYKDKAAVIKGYFDVEKDIEKIKKYIEGKLKDLTDFGIDVKPGIVTAQKTYQEDWANNWKKYYKPLRIAEDIVIKPLWEEYQKKKGDIMINIDPGMAFGTGSHETTRMCIQSLKKYVKKDSRVFDIGTGSGILSIVASKLGAKEIFGVDIDPVAVDAARKNVAYNDIDNVTILQGDMTDVLCGKADIIVSNIIAEAIIELTKNLKQFMNPDGIFICSGIIKERKKDVLDKLKERGFIVKEIHEDGEWVCIISEIDNKE